MVESQVLFGDLCVNKYVCEISKPEIERFPGGTVDTKESFEVQLRYLELKFQIDFQYLAILRQTDWSRYKVQKNALSLFGHVVLVIFPKCHMRLKNIRPGFHAFHEVIWNPV